MTYLVISLFFITIKKWCQKLHFFMLMQAWYERIGIMKKSSKNEKILHFLVTCVVFL